jgi:GNAT superfamily N-acetyltransferase
MIAATTAATGSATVGPLGAADLPAADRVFRLAFGTMLGLPDPLAFAQGADLVGTRFHADPTSAFKVEVDGELVASAFVSRWGSFAVFGPLTVHPDHWDKGFGKLLWEARLPLLGEWGTTHAGLFTRPDSTKHLHLYQRFGFWPRFLTVLTAKHVEPHGGVPAYARFRQLPAEVRATAVEACRAVTDRIYPGLDLERQIGVVDELGIGDTVLLPAGDGLDGFAVCHVGEGSEAGPGATHVKFAAARGREELGRLLSACEAFAASERAPRLLIAVNTARRDAYRALLARGHRPFLHGISMHWPDIAGFNRRDAFVLDDWR